MAIDDDMLAAYVDGELDASDRDRVEAAVAADPELAQQLKAHQELRAAMAGAFAAVLDEPVPDRLLAAVRRGPKARNNVIELSAHRPRPDAARGGGWRWPQLGAVAASLALGLFVGQRALGPREGPIVAGPGGALVARGGLARALDDQLASSGGQEASPVAIGVSFRSLDRRFCRTFQVDYGAGLAGLAGLAGVACRQPDGWRVRLALASAPAHEPAGGYRTAASELPPAVAEAVDGMIDGEPLDAKGEAAAKAAGWRQ